jgi:hypothetical protein
MTVDVKKIATLTGHSGSIYSIIKEASDTYFFTGSSDKFVALWNLETLSAEKFAAAMPSTIYSLCYVSEKKILLIGTTGGKIHILDIENKKELKILQHHTAAIFDIRYSSQTNCFYSASGDGALAICSLDTLSLIAIKKLCNEKARTIDFNYTTKELAVACGDCNIHIFDLYTLHKKKTFVAHRLSANIVKYSPDGAILLTGGRDAHLNIWNTIDYTLQTSIPAHNYAIYDIKYSPGATIFATASRDKTIKIWNAKTFEFITRIGKENYDGHINSVNKLLWSSFNDYLISVGDDRAIMVWEIKTTI